jgi:hypothetical protein
VKIDMKDLQKALEVLRKIEAFSYEVAAPGDLGALRAQAFCARSAIETSLSVGQVEVES